MFSVALLIRRYLEQSSKGGAIMQQGHSSATKWDPSSLRLPSYMTAYSQISYKRAWPDGQEKEM